jgi:hypothetical protein
MTCGCFREVKEQVAEDSAAFFAFEGSGTPVSILVDGVEIVAGLELTPPENAVRYKVARGAHDVQVVRDEVVIVRRRVYVGEGETRFISVPGR